MRVLQLHPRDTLGGTELMVVNLAQGLAGRGVDVTHATFDAPGPIAERMGASDIPTLALGESRTPAWTALGQLLRRERFDVVNAYGFHASMVARTVLPVTSPSTRMVCGVQGLVVTEVESLAAAKTRLVEGIERVTWRLVDAYEANSRGAVARLVGMGIAPDRVHFVPNGIDLGRWPFREVPPPREQAAQILCVGRFVPRKRQADVVAAARILIDRGHDIQVDFVGDGPTLGAVRAAVPELLSSRVRFHGAIPPEQVPAYLERATAFCLVSTWEGLPAVVLEALARGVPVVGSRVNGIEDLIHDGETGLTVPVGRPRAVADALERIIEDPELAAALARAGRAFLEREYSIDAMLDTKAQLYSDLLAD